IAISLNYLGPEHDAERGIDGLYEHLTRLIPQMTARGMNIVLNTVIMQENLDHLIPIAHQARHWGAKVSYSCYSDFKNGNQAHMIRLDQAEQVARVVEELIRLKRPLGNIVSSGYYLRRVPEYFRGTLPQTCQAAGKWLIQLTPDGDIKPCPELPVTAHYTEYQSTAKPIACDRCWYSCRGETQSALSIERATEIFGRV
ncbi:MAG: radical SAM protein, partial [Candidatus Latescibacteria bacterium]|nr:radical SAM protein [Candidatus Latescibacterota bacterium]